VNNLPVNNLPVNNLPVNNLPVNNLPMNNLQANDNLTISRNQTFRDIPRNPINISPSELFPTSRLESLDSLAPIY
jgi:hypothetical protein